MNCSIVRRAGLLVIALCVLSISAITKGWAAPSPQSETDFTTTAERIDALKAATPLFEDDFRSWDERWSTSSESTAFMHKGAEEAFTIQVFAPEQISWSTHAELNTQQLTDYLVEVDAAQSSGFEGDNGYGLIFRYVDERNFYLFGVSGDRYALVRVVDDAWEDLLSLTETTAFDTSEGATNRLGVLVEGALITLLINDEVVEQVEDDTFAQGAIGLAVGAFDDGSIEVVFDNVTLWSSAEQPAPGATLRRVDDETPSGTLDEEAIWSQLEQIRAESPTYYDEFRRNRGDWQEVDNEVKRYAFQDRAYHLTVLSNNRVAWSVNEAIHALEPADYLVEVDAALVDGPQDGEYGLVVRFVDDQNFYQFTLSGGEFGLFKMEAGEWETLLPWTELEDIAAPAASINRLAVLAQGAILTLLINDIPVAQVIDESFPAGGAGVVVGTFAEGGVEVAFDNLDFWAIDGSAAPLPALDPEQTQPQSNSATSQQWTTYDGAAFTLQHPVDWTVTQDEEGQIDLTGPGEEAVVIWPTFVQDEVSTTLAGAILTEFAAKHDLSTSWSSPHALAENALTMTGANDTHTSVAAIVWVNSSQGAAPTFYLLSAPSATFNSLGAAFVRILESLEIKGAPLMETHSQSINQFVEWQDPVENAFSAQVPAGWQVEGGLFRAAAVDVRPWLQLTSPDGGIQVFTGDQRIPSFTLPDSTLEWLGMTEGQWYSPGYGVQMLISRYLPGEEFAASYITDIMGLSGCTVNAVNPLIELEAALRELQRQQGPSLIGQQTDVGEVRFTCQDGQQTLNGYIFAHTVMLEQSGSGIWNVAALMGYLATPQQEVEAQAVMSHLAQSWRINPQWAAMQQGTTAAVSNIVSATGNAIASSISSSFDNAQATQDRLSQDWSDTLLEVEQVQDQDTGQVYEVMSGSTYHWIDAQGNIVGTNAHFNPDGLRFEEMVQVQ